MMKKNVFSKVLALCLALVLCMGTLAGCGSKPLTAKEHFDLTVTKQETDLNDGVITMYGNTLDNVSNGEGATLNVKVSLGDAAKTLLSTAMGGVIKFDWLNEVGLKIGNKVNKDSVSDQIGISLNGKDIASIGTSFDVANEKFYLAAPEYLDGTLSLDLKALFEGMNVTLPNEGGVKSVMDFKSWMPDAESLKKVLDKYVKVILENITDVTKEEATVEAGGVSQKCSKLITNITADTYKKILEAVANTIEKDTDLAGILDKMGTVMNFKSSEVLPEVVEQVRANADTAEQGALNITVFSDDSGNCVGMDTVVKGSGQEMTVKLSAPEQDGKTALNFELASPDGQKITVTGNGTKSGNAAEGSYSVAYNGTEILTIDAKDSDTTKSKKGILNGSYTIKAGKGIAEMVGSMSSSASAIASLLTQFSVKADIAMKDAKNGSAGISLLDNSGNKFVSFDTELTAGAGDAVTITTDKAIDMNDQSALQGALSKINFNSLIEKLTAAGVPSEITGAIKSFAAMLGA